MKALILIIATGAVLAAVAPTAGAKNSLPCSISVRHAVNARSVAPELPIAYQIRRNLQSASTCKTKHTPKRNQVSKARSTVAPTGSTSVGVTITSPATGSVCQLAPTGESVPNTSYPPIGEEPVWACVGQAAAQSSASASQGPAAPVTALAAASSSASTDGYPPADGYPLS